MEKISAKAGARFLFMHHDTTTHAFFAERSITHTPTVEVFDAAGTLVEQAVYAPSDLSRLSRVLDSILVGA